MIAYFSMEVGLESDLPTYAGGLGVLAGDTLKASADLGHPVIGITLLHRAGYFRQRLDETGVQSGAPVDWSPEEFLEELESRAEIMVEERRVAIRGWVRRVRGVSGHVVPVVFLDTELPDNAPEDRAITGALYGGDARHRLRQEAVLGLGGIALLRALGHDGVHTHHMNEGHSALLAAALLEERSDAGSPPSDEAIDAVRSRCVFTTHTPVTAGHDRFDAGLAREVLGADRARLLESCGCLEDGLDMTRLALRFSRFVNGVSLRHGQVSRTMFPDTTIHAITNGVHASTWTAPPFAELFDRYLAGWRSETALLRHAVAIPLVEIREAARRARRELVETIDRRHGRRLDENAFTIGFARRASAYKRAALLFTDTERLAAICRERGPIQIVYAGKAHPADHDGQAVIRRVFDAAERLGDAARLVWLEGYDMALAARLVAGVDLWLNTPRKPMEASGTSGMKAALNGVPSLSVLDGWWIEGHVEGVTGWSVDASWEEPSDPDAEAASLYSRLENAILPLWRDDPDGWGRVMRAAIALNGSFFTAQRMVGQYARAAWRTNSPEPSDTLAALDEA